MQLDTITALWMKAQLGRLAEVMMTHPDQLPAGVQVLGARTKPEWEAVAAGLDPATALQVLTLADQPDLFLDLEPFLRTAAARLSEPSEALSDPPPAVRAADRPETDLETHRPELVLPAVEPTEPEPTEPEPTEPGRTEPEPTEPGRTEPEPTEPEPTEPDSTEPDPTEPEPTELEPTELEPTEAEPTEAEPTEAEPTEAEPTEAGRTEPEPTEPGRTEPEPTEPEPWGPSLRELREAVMKDLAGRIDPDKLLPTVILHVHISAETLRPFNRDDDPGVARVEGIGPVLLSTVREWLGAGCRIRIMPVLDPAGIPAVDAYEVPDRMAEAVLTRSPASVFPWSGITSRRRLDLDHTIPYTGPPGGPPGQTRPDNLGPLGRGEHRFKTFGRISVRQPVAGTFVWRTRFVRVIVTNPAGTHDLGTGAFADAVWRNATQCSTSRVA